MRTRVALVLALFPLVAASCGNGNAKASLPTAAPAQSATSATGNDAPAQAARPAAATTASPWAVGNATMTGTTEPHRRSTLMPIVPGIVEKVLVSEGQRVKAGEAMVVLKTEDFQLRFRQAQAGLEAAQAQFDNADVQYKRLQSLRGKEAIPQSQLDQVEAGWKAAKAGLSNAQVMMDMAKKALRDTTIFAPYDALVVRRMISEGESAMAMPPSPLVVLEQTAVLDLKLQIPAGEIALVPDGTPVRVRFPATGQEIDATVLRVVPSANPGSRTFTAVIELPNEDGALKAGLYAEARLAAPKPAPAPEAAR